MAYDFNKLLQRSIVLWIATCCLYCSVVSLSVAKSVHSTEQSLVHVVSRQNTAEQLYAYFGRKYAHFCMHVIKKMWYETVLRIENIFVKIGAAVADILQPLSTMATMFSNQC